MVSEQKNEMEEKQEGSLWRQRKVNTITLITKNNTKNHQGKEALIPQCYTLRDNDASMDQLHNNHDVNDVDIDDDDDVDMDESDIDEDDVIDVADDKQQTINDPCMNPCMDQTNATNRDMPTDLSIRPMTNNSVNNKPPQSEQVLSRV